MRDELIEFIWRCSRMKECVEDVVVRNWDGMETISALLRKLINGIKAYVKAALIIVEDSTIQKGWTALSKRTPMKKPLIIAGTT